MLGVLLSMILTLLGQIAGKIIRSVKMWQYLDSELLCLRWRERILFGCASHSLRVNIRPIRGENQSQPKQVFAVPHANVRSATSAAWLN